MPHSASPPCPTAQADPPGRRACGHLAERDASSRDTAVGGKEGRHWETTVGRRGAFASGFAALKSLWVQLHTSAALLSQQPIQIRSLPPMVDSIRRRLPRLAHMHPWKRGPTEPQVHAGGQWKKTAQDAVVVGSGNASSVLMQMSAQKNTTGEAALTANSRERGRLVAALRRDSKGCTLTSTAIHLSM